MASGEYKSPIRLPLVVLIVVGVALMFAGNYIYDNKVLAGVEKPLEELGILINLGKTIATIGVFIILFRVVEFFFIKPLAEAINERTSNLESTFSEAEALKAEMAEMKSSYEGRIRETEAAAREEIQAEVKKAQDLRRELETKAKADAEAYLAQAKAEIDQERNRAVTELRVNVANLSLQATEKLLHANVDSDRNRALIDEFLNSVEVKN